MWWESLMKAMFIALQENVFENRMVTQFPTEHEAVEFATTNASHKGEYTIFKAIGKTKTQRDVKIDVVSDTTGTP